MVLTAIFMHSGQDYLCSERCLMPGAIEDPETGLAMPLDPLKSDAQLDQIYLCPFWQFILSKALIFQGTPSA